MADQERVAVRIFSEIAPGILTIAASKGFPKSIAVAKKADRTVYDVRYSCSVQNLTAENAGTKLPMAIPDAEISAVRFFAVCYG